MEPNGSEDLYAIKSIYNAHVGDVRVLKPTVIPEGGILTGSRDAKTWAPERKSFKECNNFNGTSEYIASLCVLPPSAQYPNGLFLVGSSDCLIHGFTPDSTEPVLRLLGHSGTVSSLSYGKGGFIVSGSWDKTARVWSGEYCLLILQGHLRAILTTAVFSTPDLILTGSADRTIRLWRSGICEQIFIGHEDSVREVAILSDMKFLSCSNDTTIRLWLTSGHCLRTFQSHTNYIYSICIINHRMDFATCGEDQKVKIWRNDACIQTFVLSSKSLWNIACLSNGDLAVGTSEGKVYVLERVPPDYFDKCAQQSCLIRDENVHSTDKESEVSRPSNLKSSFCCGEAVITYQNESSPMYICVYDNVGGTKIRKDVLDFQFIHDVFCKASNDSRATELSPINNPGPSEEDIWHTFNLQIGGTTCSIDFQEGQNPDRVAAAYVAENNLPTFYVKHIVDYIIENSAHTLRNVHYPSKTLLLYTESYTEDLRAKLIEFGQTVSPEASVSTEEVDELLLLAYNPDIIPMRLLSSFNKVISWKDEHLFPVLDLMRLGVQCKGLRSKVTTKEFLNNLLYIFLHTNRSLNRILVLKILCNMFAFLETEAVMISYQDKIYEAVKEKISTGEECIQKGCAALFLNFAIASYGGRNVNEKKFCSATFDILKRIFNSEAIYVMLVAIGTICSCIQQAISYFNSLGVMEFILKFKTCSARIENIVELLHSDFEEN